LERIFRRQKVKFEEWADSKNLSIRKGPQGRYISEATECAWNAFQEGIISKRLEIVEERAKNKD
jgi:hypothetical protein